MSAIIEYDDVRQFGVKPAQDMESLRQYSRIPDVATQVVEAGFIAGTDSIVYTVTAGKKLYLCSLNITTKNTAAGGQFAYALIRTDTNASWYYFLYQCFLSNTGNSFNSVFNPAMELPAGYNFYMATNHANLHIRLSLFGYEM